jgi:hypothetical protein
MHMHTTKLARGGTLALFAAVLLLPLFVTPSAHAADPIYTYKNQATARCIDDTDQGFRTWTCNGTNPQRWWVKDWGDGTFRFQNVNTGRCIDDSDQGFRTWTCNAGQNQSWYVTYWGDGTRRFQNQATGRCMDDSGNGFRTWSCNTGQNQSWFRQ